MVLGVLDLCPRADPAGVNIVAVGDNFAWLGCKGDLIDTKSSAVGVRFETVGASVGFWVCGDVLGMKVRAAGERERTGLGYLAKTLE